MRAFPSLLLFSLLSLNPANAEVVPLSMQSTYLRCAAISYVLQREHPDPSERDRYKNEFKLHRKWALWFYEEQHAKYREDAVEAVKIVQEDLHDKQYIAKELASEVKECISLQARTMGDFVRCLGPREPSETKKQECAKEAVGL